MSYHPILDQDYFDKHYGYKRIDLTLGRKVHWFFRQIGNWETQDWLFFISNRIPITRWLPEYNWKEWLFNDIIGGCVVSVISIPQSLAYALMIGLPPNYGLITGFIAPLLYILFGSSKHTSPGAFAIVSLMIGNVVQQHAVDIPFQKNFFNESSVCCSPKNVDILPQNAILITCSVTMLVGIFQIIFGLLNAGILAVWLSDYIVQAAVHVLSSQIRSLTGIKNVAFTSEPFGLIKFYICLLHNIKLMEISSITASFITLSFLIFSTILIDPWFKKKLGFRFPMEFCVVVLSTFFTWQLTNIGYDLNLEHVGKVDTGLMPPRLPQFYKALSYINSAITIAIVSFIIHISLAKMVSRQLKYEIDPNQEWFALGAMHTLSSIFGCFAGGSSLGRTVLQVQFATKSQISTLVCCLIMFGFAYGASPYIYYLPKAVLASIVVFALKSMFIQLFQTFKTQRESMVDFLIYVVTLTSVVLINVNYGLVIGIAFALLSFIFRSQWAEGTCLGRVPGTSEFRGITHYTTVQEIKGIKIFRFDAPIFFANAELFNNLLHTSCGINPILVGQKIMETHQKGLKKRNYIKSTYKETVSTSTNNSMFELECMKKSIDELISEDKIEQLTHVIIDCSTIPYVDLMGKNALVQAYEDYKSININVFFSHCRVAVRQLFEQSNFYENVPKVNMFVNLNDAVIQAQREQQLEYENTLFSQRETVVIARSPIDKSFPSEKNRSEDRTQSLSGLKYY